MKLFSKTWLTGTGLAIAAVLFLAVNVLSNVTLRSARFDLTEEHLFTLSDGTKKILETLEEPLILRFYLSKKLARGLPGIHSYAIRVEELLREYEQAAGGKIVLQVIDPEPFSEEEDRAVAYGLQGVPLDNGNLHFYFGLVGTSSTDEEEIIPFFQPEREEFLEYDITRLIYRLAHPDRPVVGLLSTLPLQGGNPFAMLQGQPNRPPWLIMDVIRQVAEVRTLDRELSEIPDDIDVLMLVHPKNFRDETLYAIDQFILRGGRALVFVDAYAEADRVAPNPMNPMGMQGPKHSDLDKLFEQWGIELEKGKVVGELPFAKKVNFRKQGRLLVVDYPVWFDVTPAHLNREDVVTAQLTKLTLASPGILRKREGSETTIVPLVQSDEQAMAIDVARIQFLSDVGSLARTYRPDGERFILAARITGHVKTAFPEGPPEPKNSTSKSANTESERAPHLTESKEPINIIVVADTDMLQDRFWVDVQEFLGQRIGIPIASNGNFVTNALDNLTGSNELISVRNRGRFSRPFTLVRAIQQEAEQQFRQKEQMLQERLRMTERKIRELQRKKDDQSAVILSAEQQQELARFRQELLETRKELRAVQHELQKNIESLESIVKFFNIGFMPLVIAVGGVFVGLYRLRNRRKPVPSETSLTKGRE
ncbi:MAG: ABC transporter [Nitrospirae bacterium]|nr:MAG: ABC transporter [Nitrospirota bacterium]